MMEIEEERAEFQARLRRMETSLYKVERLLIGFANMAVAVATIAVIEWARHIFGKEPSQVVPSWVVELVSLMAGVAVGLFVHHKVFKLGKLEELR